VKSFFLAAGTLWQRELVRFFRQPSRVVGALAPPILFWFLIGSGLGASFSDRAAARVRSSCPRELSPILFPGNDHLDRPVHGDLLHHLDYRDRHEGFLQSVLVAPISRGALVLGKIAGGTTLAFIQGVLFLCFCPLVGITIHPVSVLYLLLVLLLISFGLTGLGFVLAWRLIPSRASTPS